MKKIFFTIFFILIMFLVSIRCYASNEDLIGLIEDLECECTTLWEEYESYFDGDNDYNDTDNYENFYADYIVVDAGGVTEPEIYDLTGLSEEELEDIKCEYENKIEELKSAIDEIQTNLSYYDDFYYDKYDNDGLSLEEAIEQYEYKEEKRRIERENSTKVYIMPNGTKYHTEDCNYLNEEKIEIEVQDAVVKDYTPCEVCKPISLTTERINNIKKEIEEKKRRDEKREKTDKIMKWVCIISTIVIFVLPVTISIIWGIVDKIKEIAKNKRN